MCIVNGAWYTLWCNTVNAVVGICYCLFVQFQGQSQVLTIFDGESNLTFKSRSYMERLEHTDDRSRNIRNLDCFETQILIAVVVHILCNKKKTTYRFDLKTNISFSKVSMSSTNNKLALMSQAFYFLNRLDDDGNDFFLVTFLFYGICQSNRLITR